MQSKLNIAICDDEENALDIICGSVKKVFASHNIEAVADTYKSAGELLKAIQEKKYKLVFLDINMPGMDGITLGKRIVATKQKPDIVFISSNANRVFETFAVQPFGFVRKENFFADVSGVISRYVAQLQKVEEPYLQFELKQQRSYVSVNVAALEYVECFKNKQILHISENETKTVYSRMSVIEELLAGHDFIRIHKGYLVNCRFIKRFDRSSVIMITDTELPVGRSKYDGALNAYLEYIHKNGISIIG